MAKQNFSELSTEDLIKKQKTTSAMMGLLLGALTLIVLFIITRYEPINKGLTPLLTIPVALLPLLIICYRQLNSVNKELKSRESK